MAGFGLAPVLAYILETWGFSVRTPFYVTSGLCLISAVIFFALNAPMKIHALNTGPEASSRMTLASIAEVLRSRALLPVVMVFIGASVYAGLNNFQTVFADERGLNYASFFLIYTITVAAGRMSMPEAIKYIIAQVAGAIVAAAVLWVKTVGAQVIWVNTQWLRRSCLKSSQRSCSWL